MKALETKFIVNTIDASEITSLKKDRGRAMVDAVNIILPKEFDPGDVVELTCRRISQAEGRKI